MANVPHSFQDHKPDGTRTLDSGQFGVTSRLSLYVELFNAICESIEKVNIYALNGFVESNVIRHIHEYDLVKLWKLCFRNFPCEDDVKNTALINFMASIKRLQSRKYSAHLARHAKSWARILPHSD